MYDSDSDSVDSDSSLYDSSEVLSTDTQHQIREEFGSKCVICLNVATESDGGSAMALLDQPKLSQAIDMKLVPGDYQLDNVQNGLWVCEKCQRLFKPKGTLAVRAMAASFFLPSQLLNYILHCRQKGPKPVPEILNELEANPDLDREAHLSLGRYRILPPPITNPDLTWSLCRNNPDYLVDQTLDDDEGTLFIYDAKNHDCKGPADDSLSHRTKRNQYWCLHRPPNVILAFLYTHLSSTLYGQKSDYQPKECLLSAKLEFYLWDETFIDVAPLAPVVAAN